MRTQLTKDELANLLHQREEELEDKQRELEDMSYNSLVAERCKYLEGKVEVCERLMAIIEDYVSGLRGKE